MNLSQETRDAVRLMIETDIVHLPDQLGIDHLIPGCEIVNDDTYGVGTGVIPRYITVKINEYHLQAFYRGGIMTLAVGDYVSVAHMAEGDRYEVINASGATGTIATGHTPRSWLSETIPYMDFQPDSPAVVTTAGVVTEYATIAAAIAAAVATNVVVIPPGTYDESIILKSLVPVVELFTDTVTIHATTGTYAVATPAAVGDFMISVYRIEMEQAAVTATGIFAVYGQHTAGGQLKCYADLYCYNTEIDPSAAAIGVGNYGSGDTHFWGDIQVLSDGDHYGSYGARNETTGNLYGNGDIESIAYNGFAYGLRNQSTGNIKWRGDITIYTEGAASEAGYPDTGYAVGIQNRGGDIDYRGNISAVAINSDASGINCHSGGGTIRAAGHIYVSGEARGNSGITSLIATVSTTLFFHGSINVVSATDGMSVYGVMNIGVGTWTITADVVVSGATSTVGTGVYGIRNSGTGEIYALNSRSSATSAGTPAEEYDLYRDDGSLYIASVQYDTYYDNSITILTESLNALKLSLQDTTELTIDAGGEITVTQSYHRIDTDGDAASDDLDIINDGEIGTMLVLCPENGARTVVVKHNTGNIWIRAAADVSLDDIHDHLMLIYDGSFWCTVS